MIFEETFRDNSFAALFTSVKHRIVWLMHYVKFALNICFWKCTSHDLWDHNKSEIPQRYWKKWYRNNSIWQNIVVNKKLIEGLDHKNLSMATEKKSDHREHRYKLVDEKQTKKPCNKIFTVKEFAKESQTAEQQKHINLKQDWDSNNMVSS